AGLRFQFLQRVPGGTNIVVRELATGNETTIAVGRDYVDRSFFLGSGRWVGARVAPYAAGRKAAPPLARITTDVAKRRCRGFGYRPAEEEDGRRYAALPSDVGGDDAG